ncbi:hypothetical protein SDC9_75618 [bioreactor metagenome]|uniref:Uncharacterized protein n=1 Tax=bioreactor metagenome TaxID=1076179 RepID=A0A644YL77_9ZZZZ
MLQAEGDVVEYGKMREEGIALEHQAEITFMHRDVCHVDTIEGEGACICFNESCNNPEGGGFPTSRWSEQ